MFPGPLHKTYRDPAPGGQPGLGGGYFEIQLISHSSISLRSWHERRVFSVGLVMIATRLKTMSVEWACCSEVGGVRLTLF